MNQATQQLVKSSAIISAFPATRTTQASAPLTKIKPLINEPSIFGLVGPEGQDTPVSYPILWAAVKASPELIGVLTAITEDIVSDGWDLIAGGRAGGRNNKKRAEKFLQDNHAKEVFYSWVFDTLVTGDGYLYKNQLTTEKVKSFSRKVHQRLQEDHKESPTEIKSLVAQYSPDMIYEEVKAIDEDLFTPRKFIDVPSSTMKIKYKSVGGDVKKYIQKVNNLTAFYSPEEIIHFRLMRLDGKVYGYTPNRACLTLADILKDIRQYAANYFIRGGVPNWMFILKNESPKSNNYKLFQQALRQYSGTTYRYKSMVVTGDVEVQAVNQMGKDMEFKELARFLIQEIAMVWGLPASRLSDMLIQSGSKGAVTSSEGYYRKINYYQSILEDLINDFLLKEFNVTLKFHKTYKQDEVREAQIKQIMTDTVDKWYRNGWVTDEYLFYILGIPDDSRGDMKPKIDMVPQISNQNKQASDMDLHSPNSDKRANDATKRDNANESKI